MLFEMLIGENGMENPYNTDLRRVAYLGNEKFDFLIRKSASRWLRSEDDVKSLITHIIKDQNEINCRYILHSPFSFNDTLLWYESDTTHDDPCPESRDDDLGSTVYVMVNDTTEAEPIAVLLDEPLVYHDVQQTETSETEQTDEEFWVLEGDPVEREATAKKIMAQIEEFEKYWRENKGGLIPSEKYLESVKDSDDPEFFLTNEDVN
tara:strand:+ start:151 stop:771 length:621 start_codon:yes stop_codon:yes gene_type:complete